MFIKEIWTIYVPRAKVEKTIIGYVSSLKEEFKNENGDKGKSGEASDTDSGKSGGIKKVAKRSDNPTAIKKFKSSQLWQNV